MFLDKLTMECVAIDCEPLKPEDAKLVLIFHSFGKVERFWNGKPEEVTRDDALRFAKSLGEFYGFPVGESSERT